MNKIDVWQFRYTRKGYAKKPCAGRNGGGGRHITIVNNKSSDSGRWGVHAVDSKLAATIKRQGHY